MADGIKGALASLPSDVVEAVVKPVTDEIGKAIEEGVTAVVQGPQAVKSLNPQVQAQKKADEDKRRQWALRVIDWNKKLSEDQSKVQMQKQQQKVQDDQQKKQEDQVKQFKVEQKKKETPAELQARNTSETRKGVGG
jgi:hypothetical protein